MDPTERYHDTATRLIGRRVSSVWMVLYTLKVEVEATNNDPRRLQISFEPSWQLRSSTRLLTASGAIESPDDFGDDEEVRRTSETVRHVGDKARALVGRTVDHIELDPVTFELQVKFSNDIIASTFSSDPSGTLIWVLSAAPRDFAIRGTAQGIVTGIRASVV